MSGLLTALALSAGLLHAVDPETGLESWRWQGDGVDLTLNQRLPDQSRAYFQGRGFRPAEAEDFLLTSSPSSPCSPS